MPMFMLSFRFPGEAPSEAELTRWVEAEVGPKGARHLEDLRSAGDRISVCSMNFVMLIYVAKVCLAHRAVALDVTRQKEIEIALPPWSARPWVDYNWLERLRISMGRMTLTPKRPA